MDCKVEREDNHPIKELKRFRVSLRTWLAPVQIAHRRTDYRKHRRLRLEQGAR